MVPQGFLRIFFYSLGFLKILWFLWFSQGSFGFKLALYRYLGYFLESLVFLQGLSWVQFFLVYTLNPKVSISDQEVLGLINLAKLLDRISNKAVDGFHIMAYIVIICSVLLRQEAHNIDSNISYSILIKPTGSRFL